METQTSFRNKMNGEGKRAISQFKKLNKTAENTLVQEREMISSTLDNLAEVAHYLKSNWKKFLPLLVVGLGSVFIYGKKKF